MIGRPLEQRRRRGHRHEAKSDRFPIRMVRKARVAVRIRQYAGKRSRRRPAARKPLVPKPWRRPSRHQHSEEAASPQNRHIPHHWTPRRTDKRRSRHQSLSHVSRRICHSPVIRYFERTNTSSSRRNLPVKRQLHVTQGWQSIATPTRPVIHAGQNDGFPAGVLAQSASFLGIIGNRQWNVESMSRLSASDRLALFRQPLA